ncbi:MAG: flagellar protein FlaG [Planctomycetes bacterium]|nr:flagellar protein FlaG [Planctomycetota bacterium]
MTEEIRETNGAGASDIISGIFNKPASEPKKESIDSVRETARSLKLDDVQEDIISKGLLPNGERILEKEIESIVNEANQVLTGFNTSLSFEIHKTDTLMVRLKDRDSQRIISQMPLGPFLEAKDRLNRYYSLFLGELA